MKKILSLILTVVMITSMSVTAFAADSETNTGGNTTINVSGSYVPGEPADMVISVVVAWDAMNFTYTEGKKGEWLPDEHKYADDAEGTWSSETATITVTNHSNTEVYASMSFEADVDGVIGTFDKSGLLLATAEGTAYDAAPSASVEFGVSGAGIVENKTLGTINVGISRPVEVYSEEELNAAVATGGYIDVASTFDVSTLTIPDDVDVKIVFSGSCTVSNLSIADGSSVTVTSTTSGWTFVKNISIGASSLTISNEAAPNSCNITLNSSDALIDLTGCTNVSGSVVATVDGCSTDQFRLNSTVGHDMHTESHCYEYTVFAGTLTRDTTYYLDVTRYLHPEM